MVPSIDWTQYDQLKAQGLAIREITRRWGIPWGTFHHRPSTVDPETWELRQLKYSIRWTIYVPQAIKEELQRRAAARQQNPSMLVQEALARWLADMEQE